MKKTSSRTEIIFKNMFGKKHTLWSPKADFDDLTKILLKPGTQLSLCKQATIETETFVANRSVKKIVDCYEGSSPSSQEKTKALKMLAVLTAM